MLSAVRCQAIHDLHTGVRTHRGRSDLLVARGLVLFLMLMSKERQICHIEAQGSPLGSTLSPNCKVSCFPIAKLAGVQRGLLAGVPVGSTASSARLQGGRLACRKQPPC